MLQLTVEIGQGVPELAKQVSLKPHRFDSVALPRRRQAPQLHGLALRNPAVLRAALLDLLATRDIERTTAAVDRFLRSLRTDVPLTTRRSSRLAVPRSPERRQAR